MTIRHTAKTLTLVAASYFICAGPSTASSGDILVSPVLIHISPADEKDSFITDINNSVVPGLDLSTSSETLPAVGLTYMITETLAIESYLAMPPSHDIFITGLPGVNKAGNADMLPIVIFGQYHYKVPQSRLTFIGGLGVFYTLFQDIEVTDSVKQIDSTIKFIPEDSPGFAIQAGAQYALNEKLYVRASYTKMYMEVDFEITTSLPSLGNLTSTLTMDPELFMLGVAYKL
ncbi:MAG: outer membrane beta-barrel protein [Gammaproteobacteria bacterium]|nr:outer membrane beta-barrel protein [Gammaproteobacteria bacterium]